MPRDYNGCALARLGMNFSLTIKFFIATVNPLKQPLIIDTNSVSIRSFPSLSLQPFHRISSSCSFTVVKFRIAVV